MLELKNISAGYGATDIIKGVSLTLQPKENICIIGANGCGKSTLLRVIAGLLPYKGEALLDSLPIRKIKRKILSTKIAMLNQTSAIYFPYSVYDTVMMGRYVHSSFSPSAYVSQKDKEVVNNVLSTVNMLDLKDHDITTLSGGQLQRVFLARVLAQDPQIILLDEPTNHLDLKYQIELIEYLKNWAEENNRSIIGVLHDINQAMELSSYIVAMRNGEVIKQGKDIITPHLLQEIYDTDVASHMKKISKYWV